MEKKELTQLDRIEHNQKVIFKKVKATYNIALFFLILWLFGAGLTVLLFLHNL